MLEIEAWLQSELNQTNRELPLDEIEGLVHDCRV